MPTKKEIILQKHPRIELLEKKAKIVKEKEVEKKTFSRSLIWFLIILIVLCVLELVLIAGR